MNKKFSRPCVAYNYDARAYAYKYQPFTFIAQRFSAKEKKKKQEKLHSAETYNKFRIVKLSIVKNCRTSVPEVPQWVAKARGMLDEDDSIHKLNKIGNVDNAIIDRSVGGGGREGGREGTSRPNRKCLSAAADTIS